MNTQHRNIMHEADVVTVEDNQYANNRGWMMHIFSRQSITAATAVNWLMETGNTDVHMYIGIESNYPFKASLVEGVTVTGMGTSIAAYCMNRNISNTTTVDFRRVPAGVSGGQTICSTVVGGTPDMEYPLCDNGRPINEIILAQNTKYIVRVRNNGAVTSTANINLIFYEV